MTRDVQDSLPPAQARLFNKLRETGDVEILALFRALKHREPAAHETRRIQQQQIGVYITRVNRRLAARGLRIAPGERRGTYRLYRC